MAQDKDLEKHLSNALHVQATNRLSGVRVSQFMAAKINEYASGQVSSAELLAEAKKLHSGHKPSAPPEK
ncbi:MULTISPECIES: hypothetical protein [Halopseudomonas]|uniref:hypothetical protein n=1 Tax=Halopseudomonas TaxID=2901189 RepID=UPI0022B6209C|nr:MULTISPECIES: hypothetical protein [Halopseudomonas]